MTIPVLTSTPNKVGRVVETVTIVSIGTMVAWYALTPYFYQVLPFTDPAHPIGVTSALAKLIFYVALPVLLIALVVPASVKSVTNFMEFYGLSGFNRKAALYTLAALGAGVVGIVVSVLLQSPAVIVPFWASRLFAILLGAGFAEEFLFRGYMQRRLESVTGTWGAFLIVSITFGVIHIVSALVGTGAQTLTSSLLVTFIAGPLLAYFYIILKSRGIVSIIPMMAFHTMLDAFVLLVPTTLSMVTLPISLFVFFTLTKRIEIAARQGNV